jgi:hypothetical protein
MPLFMAIIHYPVTNKNGDVVTTSITNFDIHDMGRTAATFGVKTVFLVNPVPSQQWFAKRVVRHWTEGAGAAYNPTRQESMSHVALTGDLLEMADAIEAMEEQPPILVATSARPHPNTISYHALREKLDTDTAPYCLLFGTGWGLLPEIVEEADFLLPPIDGPGDYNHLSVRAAAAIILDRLRGRRET